MLDRHRFLRTNDFDLCREAYAAAGLRLDPVDTKDLRDGFAALANKFATPHFDLYFYNFTSGQTLIPRSDHSDYRLTLPARYRASRRHTLIPRISAFSSPTLEVPVAVEGQQGMIGLSLRGAAMSRFISDYFGVGAEDRIIFSPDLDTRSPADAAVVGTLMSAIRLDETDPDQCLDPLWQEQVFTSLVASLLAYWPHSKSGLMERPALGPSPRDVKRVIDFIEAHVTEHLTLARLAAVGGVPVRTLTEHFARFVGCSPIGYIRSRRLIRIHADLAAGRYESVTAAALEYGYTSLGRFAGEYRRAFGELPSETLRRAL